MSTEWPLEIFGQQPSASVHTPFLFCYPTGPSLDVDRLTTVLTEGLAHMAQAFPWTVGKVAQSVDYESHQDIFVIKASPSSTSVIVKDHRQDKRLASFAELESQEFPVDELDETLLTPHTVLPRPDSPDRSAVFTVQLNVLDGGIILAISGHHQVLDGTGQEQVCHLLDKACKGAAYTLEELQIGNLDRKDIVPLLPDSWQPGVDHLYLRKSHPAQPSPVVGEGSRLAFANIIFSTESLRTLKEDAQAALHSGFVSSNDALTALIWQTTARARRARLPGSTKTTLGRAINPRRYLGIHKLYPGYISNMAYSDMTLDELSEASLGQVAAMLRAAVDPETSNLGQLTRELATLIHRATDKDSVSITNHLDLDTDLMISSWVTMRCCDFDFGLGLGKPVAFRRPKHDCVPSLIFLLPRQTNGDVVVTLCLREDDLGHIRQDAGFTRFGRFSP